MATFIYRKIKKRSMDSQSYIRKISSHDKIDDLAAICKDFFREFLKLKYEFTFTELKDIASKKHSAAGILQELSEICRMFEELEYRQKKPGKAEITALKDLLRSTIRKSCPVEEVQKKAKQSIFNPIKKSIINIKKNSEKKQEIAEKTAKAKNSIVSRIFDRLKTSAAKPKKDEEDYEMSQIKKYIETSKAAGIKIPEIKKELKEMGFPVEKINKSFN